MKRREFVRSIAAAGASTTLGPGIVRPEPNPSSREVTRLDTGWHFIRGDASDAHDVLVGNAWENVAFGVSSGSLVGANPFSTDAGIASILLQTERDSASHVYALSVVRSENVARILGASLALIGSASTYQIRYTTDGTVPGLGSQRYVRPIETPRSIRAALVSGGKLVVTLDEATPRFRVQGSAPPESRDPFRHD